MFFSFDGIDGVGKTTQMKLFHEWLDAQGFDVVLCRDPGSTALGEALRAILLDRADLKIGRRSEMLMYMAARAQLVEEVISPALAAGKVVMSDRYLLANVVYQGHAGGLDVDALWQVGQIATDNVTPNMTFLLDMEPDAARGRLNRPLDRMEKQGEEFRGKLRGGFLAEARRNPKKISIIDAARPIETVQNEIRETAARLLQASGHDTPRSSR